MPSANAMTTPVTVDLPELQGRYAELDAYTVGFESYTEDVDPAPLFRGLPDDRCQCPHWGIVTEGSITVRYGDGTEETTRAGELYYWPGGHTGWTDTGVAFVELSPAEEIAPVLAHLAAAVATG